MNTAPQFLDVQNGEYHTPEGKTGWFAKLFPTFVFYVKIVNVVFKASSIAKKGKYTVEEWAKSSYSTIQALESVGCKLHITGLDHIKGLSTPCVFTANHMSVLETFALSSIITPYRNMSFVIKKSLATYPVFRHVMMSVNPVVVGRENPREDLSIVMNDGQARLDSGSSVFIFPQRTRTKSFDPETFNTIGLKLAKRAGVPVIPVALKTDAWGQGKKLKDFGGIYPEKEIYIEFGEPMSIEGNGKEQHAKTIEFIENRFESWKNGDA